MNWEIGHNIPTLLCIKYSSITNENLPGKFHGQSCLAGYSPWGGKELDTTEPTRNRAQGTLLSALW